MAKKRGLGKGLNELLSATLGSAQQAGAATAPSAPKKAKQAPDVKIPASPLQDLPLEQLHAGPFQPRNEPTMEGLEQLAESIRAQGILQPILVREVKEGFEIIAGERRFRAAKLAGLETVPVIVREVSDEAAMAMALIENIQREDLNPIEEAVAIKRLADDLELTHLQIAEGIGRSRTSVTNTLRLLTLHEAVQGMLASGDLEMGHARALLALKGELQEEVAKAVAQRGLSVRETERLVNKMLEGAGFSRTGASVVDPNIRRLEEDLADKLGAKVAIRHQRTGKGAVVIRYHNVDELEGILAHVT